MAGLTRRLHMGCGEALQSHLPESFRKVVDNNETKEKQTDDRYNKPISKGRLWK